MSENISKRERRALLVVSLVMSLFVAGHFVVEAVYQYNDHVLDKQLQSKGISFSKDDWGRRSPAGLLLLVPMITFSLIRPKRFWVSSGLTLLLSVLYAIGCYLRVMNAIDLGILNPIANSFALWDYLFGVFLIIMIIWQASILIRIARAPIQSLP